jgi:hypothetical protein
MCLALLNHSVATKNKLDAQTYKYLLKQSKIVILFSDYSLNISIISGICILFSHFFLYPTLVIDFIDRATCRKPIFCFPFELIVLGLIRN